MDNDTATTRVAGAGWFPARISEAALVWRDRLVLAARLLVGLLVLHAVTVSPHLRDFVQD